MKGSIRALVGFFIAYGAVGTLETDPTASELGMLALALVGLAIMGSGILAINRAEA